MFTSNSHYRNAKRKSFFCTTVMRIRKKMFHCNENNNVTNNPKPKDPKNRLNFY